MAGIAKLRPARLALAALVVALGVALPARAIPLVADLSEHLVAITTGFAGADVLLFGAVEDEGDVVVVVRGPEQNQVMHRKSEVAGIWINTARAVFESVPSYYFVASSRPLEEIAETPVLRSNEMGLDQLRLNLRNRASPNIVEQWRSALIRNKQREGLYVREPQTVTFLGDNLFRTTVSFPTNVPVGLYRVDTYFLREGRIVSAQTTPLNVSKIGLEAELYSFAHDHAGAYGVVAVVFALVAGWLGHLAFRRP